MTMIIKDGQLVEDTWLALDAQEPLPKEAPHQDLIVPLARWADERETLAARTHAVGLALEPTDDVWTLADGALDGVALVSIAFPKFTDGRGYSQAWILRHHLGFEGELRAVGDVLRDQLHHMQRCGFNAFQVRADKDPKDALKAFETYTIHYQETHTPPSA